MLDFHKIATQCQHALVEQLVPFWLQYACDSPCGGYFDYLTPTGTPLDADKRTARQAEQVWAFAYLYTAIDAQSDWLDHALHGADFLAQYAHTARMACYTQLSRTGQPVAPQQGPLLNDPITSSRVASAYALVHVATADDQWAMLAKQTLQMALRYYQTEREAAALAPADEPQPLRYLAQPVALLRALLDARPLFDVADWKEATEPLLDEILNEFLDKRHDLLRDHVGVGGAFNNTPAGRRVSPGLTMETAALLIDVSTLLSNRKLTLQATNWCLRLCQWAWPEAAPGRGELSAEGNVPGLPRYLDWKGQPLTAPNATNRVAGDHVLALSALANGYWHTRHPEAPRWLRRIADYTFQHFPDTNGPAWHLALSAHHQPVTLLKTTADEGCYALVRGLADTWQHLDQCARLQPISAQRLTSNV
ncbi:N-acylglucosamine 2-epimerase [Fibrella aestuarina BUZ 2]|uniref:N-acylglucosamine 2-epimerase n=1 Tax=Fibrella aestuarina BUZ 2 TaxID=1166018 RepID=I0K2R9_9BACT|nr:AGE family epimerase/isomerase [Fibrella aestuarina]CCG98422.1 N-acylglucosamine 2-epimerase [Fibrella aestuarina BUZ 2]